MSSSSSAVSSSAKPETSGLVLYTSSVAGSIAIEKNTERVRFLLQAAKAAFTEVDVSLSVVDKEYLHKHSGHEKKITLPQSKDEIEEANEYGELKELLRLK